MSDDRKKKLEELRKKNLEARSLLARGGTTTPTVTSVTNTDSNASNSISTSNQTPISKVDQIIREATTKAPADINLEEIRKATKRTSKYMGDGYSISKISDSFLGKMKEMYEEGCQVEFEDHREDSEGEEEEEKTTGKEGKVSGYRRSVAFSGVGKKVGPNIIKKTTDLNLMEDKALNKDEKENVLMHKINKIPVNDERRNLNSQEVNEFLQNKSKYVERALGEKEIFDIFKTYYDEDDYNDMDVNKRSWVSPCLEFFDENCAGRAVTSLEWSLKHNELMLAAYSKSDDFNINQSNGLILLWSLAMRKTPEFSFSCQTEITSAIFHKYNPKLVVGATYTGQILIWDTRGKPLPVMKTPPGGKFHSHPIFCLGVTGTTNANNIISISNDGVLCTWSMSNLSKPTKRMELKAKKRKTGDGIGTGLDRNYSEEIGAICMATQENETNNIFVGSDDSDIYQIYVHQSNDNVDNVVETYKKHTGPINSLDMHPGDYHKTSNFSHLMLSASADWTVNLWSKNFSDAPLFTFDNNDDYVYDAKFHPTNPSLFACADGLGKLDFWDLNKDVEVPVYRYDVGKNSLNKIAWSQDGKRIAVGDITGKLSVLNIEKELYNSKVEDPLKFEKIISIAKNNKKGF